MEYIKDNKKLNESWQRITNILAELLGTKVALINKIKPQDKDRLIEEDLIEVLYKNEDEANPFSLNYDYKLSGLYCQKIYNQGAMIEVHNALKEGGWDDNPALDYNLISYLGYPIKNEFDQIIGTICVEDDKERRFSAAEKELVFQFKEVIEDHLKQLEINDKLNETMKRGQELHQQFLPDSLPEIDGLSFGSYYRSAECIGGDFYDLIEYKNSLVFYISDVSGHDLSSSMLNIFLKEAINSFLLLELGTPENISPAKILEYISYRFSKENFSADYFISLVIGIIDLDSYEMRVSNAGFHFLPLIINSEGDIVNINHQGLPIANIGDNLKFSEVNLTLEKGDGLFLYTDGLAEQVNAAGEMFGEEKIIKVLSRYYDNAPAEIIDKVGYDFRKHRANKTIADDITVLMIKRD
ncbi:MAG: GAF domain-containing SpoIIE family protein phosphatase [Halarsenatibacteraceae bacterium]